MKYLIFTCIILLAGIVSASDSFISYEMTPDVDYGMSPFCGYTMAPTQPVKNTVKKAAKVTKETVKEAAKVVKKTAKKVRKIVGYRKICTPYGCRMEPIYQMVETTEPTVKEETKVTVQPQVTQQRSCSSCSSCRRGFFRRLFRR